jgi:hypothetical protein
MSLIAQRYRHAVDKLEATFGDLVVESYMAGGSHRLMIAVMLHDPDFSDADSWAPSLAVRVHAANLVVRIPETFPAEHAVVSVHRLDPFPLAPHPLLRATTEPNVFMVDYQEVEYRQSHSATATLLSFVDCLLRSLCAGPDPLVIPEFYDFWRASQTATAANNGNSSGSGSGSYNKGPDLQRRRSRMSSLRASGEFPLLAQADDSYSALHRAAAHAALFPADLEKMAAAHIARGKMGLMFKQGRSFAYYAGIRTFTANG